MIDDMVVENRPTDSPVVLIRDVTLARSMECELNDIIHQLGKGYESGRYMDGLVIALNMIEEKAVELESIAYPPKLEVVR